jgi:hypothetical protein
MVEMINTQKYDFKVVQASFKLFTPKGTFTSNGGKAPGRVSFAEMLATDVPSGSSWAIEFRLEDLATKKRCNWTLNPRIAGASTARIAGQKSQWDLIMESLFNAGVRYSIKGISGLIETDTNAFRSTNGEEVGSGYAVRRLIEQDDLEVDLASGEVDKEVFGEKFKFLKGLNDMTKTIEHLGLNSGCYIQEKKQEEVVTGRRKAKGKTATGNTASNAVSTSTEEMI